MAQSKMNLSILLVDDEPLVLELLKETFSHYVKHVYLARDGADAFEQYQNNIIDVIISDVDMPYMNGIELLKHVRAIDKNIPFILITGLKNLDVLIQAIEYKITAFIPKPVNVEELLSKVKEIAHAKHLEHELTVNQSIFEQYKHAVDVSSIVSKTNYKGIITYVNDRFCEVSGYTRDELIGQPHNIVRGIDMPSVLFKELWETIRSKKIWRGILHNRAKDGHRYTVKTTVSPIIDSDGEIYEFIAIREDITELENAKKIAEESARIKGQFLANMSHEIRTPMNAIIGFVDLIKNTQLDDTQKRYLEIVGKSTQHLLSIVNEILDLSKIENNKLVLDPSNIDLRAELELFCELYRPNIEEKHLKYSWIIDSSIHSCLRVDIKHLKQVLGNLISNAIKFTNNGSIEISIAKTIDIEGYQRIRFSVKDTGIGVAADKQKAIFDPFNQADYSMTRQYGGTGLGLSISSKIVELMGSVLNLNSTLGEGSDFYFDVDLALCHQNILEVDESPVSMESCQNEELCVLVVEDNETNMFLMQELLNDAGVTARYAYNGKEAVDMINKDEYDMVFMDINMPVMSGIEATKILRDQGNTIPIIALTANAMAGDREKFIGLGMDDYLSKPLKESSLLQMIKKYGQKTVVTMYKKQLRETLNIDAEVVDRLFNLFFTSVGAELNNLKTAIDSNDVKQIYVISHKISGSASNLRFDEVVRLAKEIEDNAKHESGIDYYETYEKLIEAFNNAKKEVEAEEALDNPAS